MIVQVNVVLLLLTVTDVSTTCAVVIFRVKQTADKYPEGPMKMVLRDLYQSEIWLKVNFASIFSKNRQPGKLLFFTRKVNTVFFLLKEFKLKELKLS